MNKQKNRTLFVIAHHSFVDLITNSSSELFICNTDKTVTAVKSILNKLLETHAELTEMSDVYTFSYCFGSIEAAEFTYDTSVFDQGVVDIFNLYNEYNHDYNGDNCHSRLYADCQTAERELARTHPYYNSDISRKRHDEFTVEEEKAYDIYHKDYITKSNTIWTPYGTKKLQSTCDLFIEFLKFNKFEQKDIDVVVERSKEHINNYKSENTGRYDRFYNLDRAENFPRHLSNAFEFFVEAYSWNLVIHKGNILVHSASDNTIPYELFDSIESYLSACRYHLG